MYKFEYSLTDSDYVKFNVFHAINSKSGKKNIFILRLMVPVILFSMLFIQLLNKENRDAIFIPVIIFIYMIISIVWFFLAKYFQIYFIKKILKKIKKDGKPPYGKNNLMKFDEDFIYEITDKSESKTTYKAIEKATSDDNAIYVYLDAMRAYIVPLRVFESDEQKESFLKFITDKIKSTL